MTILSAAEAGKQLCQLIDEASINHEPITITGKRGNAVLISESDWRAIQETLFLVSITGMRDSILEGLKTPVEDCSEDPAITETL
jgi:prevent-host-death family protein